MARKPKMTPEQRAAVEDEREAKREARAKAKADKAKAKAQAAERLEAARDPRWKPEVGDTVTVPAGFTVTITARGRSVQARDTDGWSHLISVTKWRKMCSSNTTVLAKRGKKVAAGDELATKAKGRPAKRPRRR